MIATWSANATWVAGDRLMTSTAIPCFLASAAAFSKKSVAVLNTPVMSGGVQPITTLGSLGPARADRQSDRITVRLMTTARHSSAACFIYAPPCTVRKCGHATPGSRRLTSLVRAHPDGCELDKWYKCPDVSTSG